MKEVDIHNQKEKYSRLLKRIEGIIDTTNKEIINKYVEWHNYQIEQSKLAYSSSIRSLTHALNLCDYFPDITKATQKQVEEWYAKELEKPKTIKTGSGKLLPTKGKRSVETLEDVSTQGIKFFKFVKFLSKDKPLLLFNSKKMSLPEQFEFVSIDTNKRKEYEKPRVSQEEMQKIIEYLWTQKSHVPKMLGALVALLNDSGMRFGEATTLQIRDITPEEDYLIISLRESKTKTRTVVSMLAKPYLIDWIGMHPQKDNKEALVFCSSEGSKVDYAACRKVFNASLNKLKITWREQSSFHYIRHLFASRATVFPDFFLKYWLGWHDRSMRAHYSQNTYKECLGYYKQMIQQEKNPMLNHKLSFIEEKQRSQEELLIETIREQVRKEMRKN